MFSLHTPNQITSQNQGLTLAANKPYEYSTINDTYKHVYVIAAMA